MYARYIPPSKPRAAPAPDLAVPDPSVPRPANGLSSSKPYARWLPPTQPNAPEPIVVQPKKIVFGDDDFPMPAPKKRKWEEEFEVPDPKQLKPKKMKQPVGDVGAGDGLQTRNKSELGSAHSSPDTEPTTKPRKSKKERKEKKVKKRNNDERHEQGEQGEQNEQNEVQKASPEPTVEADTRMQPDNLEGVDKVNIGKHDAELKKEKRDKKKEKKKKASEDDSATGGVSVTGDNAVNKRYKSVFARREKALGQSQETGTHGKVDGTGVDESKERKEAPVLHGLEPLPQPDPVITDDVKITYETLPRWLASPVRVTSTARTSWNSLGIRSETAQVLASNGFADAFAVQTVVLPLLMPSPERPSDVVVAAATGSGKTLAYVLPIMHHISNTITTRLRALIVLPTRDLVQQVQVACGVCATAFSRQRRVMVGTAVGNHVFKEEQNAIMEEVQNYDPGRYLIHMQKRTRLFGADGSEDEDIDLDISATEPLPDHVVTRRPKADILICTPGRLVEHIRHTPGFTLDYVRWLVVDEADKLLVQDFQQWLETVLVRLPSPDRSGRCGLRKVVLSATMTHDLTLLGHLQLRRPKLVLLEGTRAGEQVLPSTLKEFAIKISDPSFKPLYLVDLIDSKHLSSMNSDPKLDEKPRQDGDETNDVTNNNAASDHCRSSSPASACSSSDAEADNEHGSRKAVSRAKARSFQTTVLIFTKSNEAALRLSRLLAILSPDLAHLIGTLTSSTKTSRRARTLKGFAQGKLRILVASDLVSRGIDLVNLDHVINYDLPISEASYVHRVGRTARAGRDGQAWTLLEYAEARRFWRDFAGEGEGASSTIVRSRKIERVRLGNDKDDDGLFAEDRLKAYEHALEQLKREAGRDRKR